MNFARASCREGSLFCIMNPFGQCTKFLFRLCCSSVDVFYYLHMRDILVKNELRPPLCSDRTNNISLLVGLVVVEHIDLFQSSVGVH